MKFLDSNILIYAYDKSAKNKYTKAQNIVIDCWNDNSGVISTQVLQEFYVTVTKKLPKAISKREARDIIKELLSWPVYAVLPDDIIAASELQEQLKYSFWDSLIITAAQKSGASILYSEDMQDGQQIGNLKIVNPYKE